MSIFTRNEIFISADKRTKIGYDQGTGRLTVTVEGTAVGYFNSSGFVFDYAVTQVNDANGSEVLKFGSTASAVNEVTITNKATGASPTIAGSGDDTNVGLRLAAKGTAYIGTNNPFVPNNGAAKSVTANTTLTAAELLAGIVVCDPSGADKTLTWPTAAAIVAAIPGVAVGDTIRTLVVNGADGAENVIIAADASGGFDANQTASSRKVAQNASKLVHTRITNIGSGTQAYVIYA